MSSESDPYFKPFDPNPSSAANNRHHQGGYRSDADYLAEAYLDSAPGNPDNLDYYAPRDDPSYKPDWPAKEYDDTNG